MRHVFSSDEIPHLWAHKTQSEGRNSRGNFYFHGDTIYSYGSHFPIARHVTKNRGRDKAILFTTRSYSSMTAKHIGAVARAIPDGMTVLRVSNVAAKPQAILKDFDIAIQECTSRCFGPTGRFRSSQWDSLDRLVSKANAFSEWFGYKKRWTTPETHQIREFIDAKTKRDARDVQRKAKRDAELRAERMATQLKHLRAWKAGSNKVKWFDRETPVGLRIVGDEVETSMGVRFPVDHAVRGISFIEKHLASGWKRNGHSCYLGTYTIDEIEIGGNVRAGCHYVQYAEIKRIAKLLAKRG